MDKARQAVSSFVSKDGHHKTSVDEDVNRAVTEEHVRPHRHEEVTTAIDKEVHQDHHHTTIQPVKDQQTLPEKHHHNVVPVTHKTIEHGNDRETKDVLDREHAKFKNTSTTHDTTHTSTAAPVVTGERVHHHVHEHIQPVIQKDTIQPHVVHTTVPVHETHHAKPVHHGSTTLPTKTLDEFTREKGSLDGPRHHKYDEFDGCPDKINKGFADSEHAGVAGTHSHGHGHSHGTGSGLLAPPPPEPPPPTTVTTPALLLTVRTASLQPSLPTLATLTTKGIRHGTHTTGVQNDAKYTTGSTAHGASSLNKTETHDATGKKISLVDKLNPFKDADGDGHKGIMS
ncbi:allergen protein [Colletotrichum tofieldiae]|nr:allergen protein [Colletotrichum tofieldiae]